MQLLLTPNIECVFDEKILFLHVEMIEKMKKIIYFCSFVAKCTLFYNEIQLKIC